MAKHFQFILVALFISVPFHQAWSVNTTTEEMDEGVSPENSAGPWQCRARANGFDKHGEHYASGASKNEAYNRVKQVCDLFHFPGACVVEKCWSNPNNLESSNGEDGGNDSSLNNSTVADGQEYLGCTTDDQQCAARAANHGYRHYRTGQTFCPKVVPKGCWGVSASANIFATDSVENDRVANEWCPRFTKQILCVSQFGCSWTNGRCVND